MPALRLPPLPPARWIPKYLTKKIPAPGKDYPKRLQLINPVLCDQVVRDLGIRDDEVVVEVYSGVGSMTRSLLNGGRTNKADIEELRTEWWKAKSPTLKGLTETPTRKPGKNFPVWLETFRDEFCEPDNTPYLPDDPTLKKPKLVVAVEPNPHNLRRSYDAVAEVHVPHIGVSPSARSPTGSGAGLEVCRHEERLICAFGDPYYFETLLHVLADPMVTQHLPVMNPSGATPADKVKRKWTDDAPPLTLIVNGPRSSIGGHLNNTLITSAIGAARGEADYIWAYGRIRLVLMLDRFEYDRLMAKPGEMNFSKGTIFAQALFDLRPIAPKHHVHNVGRLSQEIDTVPLRSNQNSPRSLALADSYKNEVYEKTTTYSHDYMPQQRGDEEKLTARNKEFPNDPLVRPQILGLVLEPKLDPIVKWEQRTEWDYVLRHCMVKTAQPLSHALDSLGFGASNLMKDIQGDGPFAGVAVEGDPIVRELTIPEWARVVDVFASWPFKPDTSILDPLDDGHDIND